MNRDSEAFSNRLCKTLRKAVLHSQGCHGRGIPCGATWQFQSTEHRHQLQGSTGAHVGSADRVPGNPVTAQPSGCERPGHGCPKGSETFSAVLPNRPCPGSKVRSTRCPRVQNAALQQRGDLRGIVGRNSSCGSVLGRSLHRDSLGPGWRGLKRCRRGARCLRFSSCPRVPARLFWVAVVGGTRGQMGRPLC